MRGPAACGPERSPATMPVAQVPMMRRSFASTAHDAKLVYHGVLPRPNTGCLLSTSALPSCKRPRFAYRQCSNLIYKATDVRIDASELHQLKGVGFVFSNSTSFKAGSLRAQCHWQAVCSYTFGGAGPFEGNDTGDTLCSVSLVQGSGHSLASGGSGMGNLHDWSIATCQREPTPPHRLQ
jgi:hypothetical protein